jgi:3',5'-cyclic AMP phosphodiesterase CpdA
VALVLRYSDFRADTLEEHRRVLARTGSVWWGWWKKLHEDYPEESIRKLQRTLREGLVEIGFVNRGPGIFVSAKCRQAEDRSGNDFLSPQPTRTPAYYRYQSFPLWLEIVELEELENEVAWVSRFGPVPIGDDTFFDDSTGAVEVIEEGPDEALGFGILHISDLHFGNDHAFSSTPLVGQHVALEKRIADSLGAQPAGVVVSGDLTTQGDNDGLVEARMFLERLSDLLRLPRERFVIAPGNHDILVKGKTVTNHFENEQHFRTQMLEFYGHHIELERIHQFKGADGIYYVFVCLNSSRPRDTETMNYGYVGRDRSGPIMKEASQIVRARDDATWMAVVLHHHILPSQQVEYAVPNRPVSLAIDAGEIVAIAADNGFDAILHGHEHVPFVGTTARIAEFGAYSRSQIGSDNPILILAAGSVGVKTERLPPEMPFNSFNYYDVQPQNIRVQLHQFNSIIDPRVPSDWDFDLRRT